MAPTVSAVEFDDRSRPILAIGPPIDRSVERTFSATWRRLLRAQASRSRLPHRRSNADVRPSVAIAVRFLLWVESGLSAFALPARAADVPPMARVGRKRPVRFQAENLNSGHLQPLARQNYMCGGRVNLPLNHVGDTPLPRGSPLRAPRSAL